MKLILFLRVSPWKGRQRFPFEPPPLCEKQMHTEYRPSANSNLKDIQSLREGLVCKKTNPCDSRQDQNTLHNRATPLPHNKYSRAEEDV